MAAERLEFKDLIRRLRMERGLSQAELAERLGMAQRTVSSWETGDALPRPRVIRKLAQILNYPEADLMIAANLARTAAEAKRIAESDRPVYDIREPRNQLLRLVREATENEIYILLDLARSLRRAREQQAKRGSRAKAAENGA